MKTQQAVCQRIRELMKEQKMSINKLAERAGVHHSTLGDILADDSPIRNTGVTTIKKVCQGLGIEFEEFWNSELFHNLDYEE
mgnify:CR=1 FL=1